MSPRGKVKGTPGVTGKLGGQVRKKGNAGSWSEKKKGGQLLGKKKARSGRKLGGDKLNR